MVLVGEGRYSKPTKSRSLISISQKVASDSTFPFEEGQRLTVTIDSRRGRLVIERAPDSPAKRT